MIRYPVAHSNSYSPLPLRSAKSRKNMRHKILIIDDDPAIGFALKEYLNESGYEGLDARNLSTARQILSETDVSAILLDLKLPEGNSMNWIPETKKELPEVPIFVITGAGDIPTAVKAMRMGADYFAEKPLDVEEIMVVLGKCLEVGELRRRFGNPGVRRKKEEAFFGTSSAIQHCLEEAHACSAVRPVAEKECSPP